MSIWRVPAFTPYFAVCLHHTYSYEVIETTSVTWSALALCRVSACQPLILGSRTQVIPVASKRKNDVRYLLVEVLLQIEGEEYRRQNWWQYASERTQFPHVFIEPWHSEFALECIIQLFPQNLCRPSFPPSQRGWSSSRECRFFYT